jgi:hypothetical protein
MCAQVLANVLYILPTLNTCTIDELKDKVQ